MVGLSLWEKASVRLCVSHELLPGCRASASYDHRGPLLIKLARDSDGLDPGLGCGDHGLLLWVPQPGSLLQVVVDPFGAMRAH